MDMDSLRFSRGSNDSIHLATKNSTPQSSKPGSIERLPSQVGPNPTAVSFMSVAEVTEDLMSALARVELSALRNSPPRAPLSARHHRSPSLSAKSMSLELVECLAVLSAATWISVPRAVPGSVSRLEGRPHLETCSASSTRNTLQGMVPLHLGCVKQMRYLQHMLHPKRRRRPREFDGPRHATNVALSASPPPLERLTHISALLPLHHVTSDFIRVHSCSIALHISSTGYEACEGSFDRLLASWLHPKKKTLPLFSLPLRSSPAPLNGIDGAIRPLSLAASVANRIDPTSAHRGKCICEGSRRNPDRPRLLSSCAHL